MPVNAAARIMEVTDKRLWRVVEHYVAKAVSAFDLSAVEAIGMNETASKRGHNYVRWPVLKRGDVNHLTTNQLKAMAELLDQGLDTVTARRVKERLRWVRQASTPRAVKWRITRFINYASELVGESPLLEPIRKALPLRSHAQRVVRRWTSTYTNARFEGVNGLFQAVRTRARGYRNTEIFTTMIYLIASPAGKILEST